MRKIHALIHTTHSGEILVVVDIAGDAVMTVMKITAASLI